MPETKKRSIVSPAHKSPSDRKISVLKPLPSEIRKPSLTPKNQHSKSLVNDGGMRHKFIPSNHHFCVPIIGYTATFDPFEGVEGHEKGSEFGVVIDYCDGNVLRTQIEGIGRLKEYDVLRWTLQVCQAVKHMHSRNVCHLGLKTDVVQLTGSVVIGKLDAVVISFSSAKQCEDTTLECELGEQQRVTKNEPVVPCFLHRSSQTSTKFLATITRRRSCI